MGGPHPPPRGRAQPTTTTSFVFCVIAIRYRAILQHTWSCSGLYYENISDHASRASPPHDRPRAHVHTHRVTIGRRRPPPPGAPDAYIPHTHTHIPLAIDRVRARENACGGYFFVAPAPRPGRWRAAHAVDRRRAVVVGTPRRVSRARTCVRRAFDRDRDRARPSEAFSRARVVVVGRTDGRTEDAPRDDRVIARAFIRSRIRSFVRRRRRRPADRRPISPARDDGRRATERDPPVNRPRCARDRPTDRPTTTRPR